MISLGDRMKRYENVNRDYLIRRMPVIIRLDGKKFSSWTRHCTKPFDVGLSYLMMNAMWYLNTHIQGAVFGYTQSDEISILIRDYDTLTTDMWFDGNIQKMASISASMLTAIFNKAIPQFLNDLQDFDLATFDARVFNIPKEEVCNYFIWRQSDIQRNSVQMMGQHYLGHKRIQGLNNESLAELLEAEGYSMSKVEHRFTHGVCTADGVLDQIIPLFREDREYIDRHVYINESSQLTTEV